MSSLMSSVMRILTVHQNKAYFLLLMDYEGINTGKKFNKGKILADPPQWTNKSFVHSIA